MSDGATTTLAKFFSVQSRKASAADECKGDHFVSILPCEDTASAKKAGNIGSSDDEEVIEYEDFLKELQADRSGADEPKTEVTAKVNRDPLDEEMLRRDDSEQRNNLTKKGDAVTLSSFFTITNKGKRYLDSEEISATINTISEERESSGEKVVAVKKSRHKPRKKRHRSKCGGVDSEVNAVAKSETVKIEVQRKTSDDNNTQLMETSLTDEKCTDHDASILSVDDVKRLIDNSLVEAGITQSPSVAQTPQAMDKGYRRTHVSSRTDADSPASSKSSRISLRDVRRRRQNRREAEAKQLLVDTKTATDGHKSNRKKGRKKKAKINDDAHQGSQAKPIIVDGDSFDDKTEVNISDPSTPVKQKRRSARPTPSKGSKKRKIGKKSAVSDDDSDVNIVVVKETVDSPRSKRKEERLAKLYAMSSKDEFANLKSNKTSVSFLTQAELFPTVAHVTQLPQDEDDYSCQLKFKPRRMDETVISQTNSLNLSIDRVPSSSQHRPMRKKLAAARVKKELKKLQALLPDYPVNEVYESLASKASVAEEDQLWTNKYSPSTLSQLLAGKGHVEVINEWLSCWKKELVEGKSTLRKKTKKPSTKKRVMFLNDAVSDENEEELTQTPILVISGAPGLGKTTCAFTIATLLGYKVFEMNPSMLRTTRTVLERVHESTRSQQVQKGKGVSIDKIFDEISQGSAGKPTGGIASFFTRMAGKKKGADLKTAGGNKKKSKPSVDPVKEDDGADAVSLSKLSLVLFDEADVSFEEDKGFYEAIKSLGAEAKKPIILTCQSTNFLRSLGVEHTHVEITPHEESEVAAYLCVVSLMENEVADLDAMRQLVRKYNCDIRKCLLHVQYLVCSGGLRTCPQQLQGKQQKRSQPEDIHQLARACRHRSSLDLISNHHRLLLSNGAQPLSKLTSNPSNVFVETGGITKPTADPVTWSSVRSLRTTYNELLRESYIMPKRLTGQELTPQRVLLSIREELPLYMAGISDDALMLDCVPFVKAVCVSENERRASKTSRRFLHYLAKQGLHLTEADQTTIISMFSSPHQENS